MLAHDKSLTVNESCHESMTSLSPDMHHIEAESAVNEQCWGKITLFLEKFVGKLFRICIVSVQHWWARQINVD